MYTPQLYRFQFLDFELYEDEVVKAFLTKKLVFVKYVFQGHFFIKTKVETEHFFSHQI